MVSFIISYTSAILFARVQPKSQPLSTLSPRSFGSRFFARSLPASFSLLPLPFSFSLLSLFFLSLSPIDNRWKNAPDKSKRFRKSSGVFFFSLGRLVADSRAYSCRGRRDVRLFKDFSRGNKNWSGGWRKVAAGNGKQTGTIN